MAKSVTTALIALRKSRSGMKHGVGSLDDFMTPELRRILPAEDADRELLRIEKERRHEEMPPQVDGRILPLKATVMGHPAV